jgi:DNA-binding transcriptional LysR family regulator
MEMKQLQYFRAVAKRHSISLAAEDLYITQPALSRCIRRLEEEVGTPLFSRTNNGVYMTPAGEAFLVELDQAALHFERGLSNARMTGAGEQPTLSIASSFEEFDNSLVYQLHEAYPAVRTSFDILPPTQAYRELLAGNVDFAVIPQLPDRSGVGYEHLLSEEMLLSPSEDNPLYGKRFVSVEELNGCNLICNEVAFDWASIDRICREQRIAMNPLMSSNDHQTVGQFKKLTGSMIFIPISAVAEKGNDDRQLTFPARVVPQVFRRNVFVAYQEGKRFSAAEKYFMKLLRETYQKKQQLIQDFSVRVFGSTLAPAEA